MESKKRKRFGMLGIILYLRKKYRLIKASIYKFLEEKEIDSLDYKLLHFFDDNDIGM